MSSRFLSLKRVHKKLSENDLIVFLYLNTLHRHNNCSQVHTATLFTIYRRIKSEWHSQSENGIRHRTLVDLY